MPSFLAKHGIGYVSLVPFKTKAPELSLLHPQVTGWFMQDALLLMPAGPCSNECGDQKVFFKG